MGPNACHLMIGHGDSFKAYNPNVVDDAALVRNEPDKRKSIIEHAKLIRLLSKD